MGDIVRPDFSLKAGVSPAVLALDPCELVRSYGKVGSYGVALYGINHPGSYRMLNVKLTHYETNMSYPLAVLPATEEGNSEARAIAGAVLEALRVMALIDSWP
jgi:hypothetical protein